MFSIMLGIAGVLLFSACTGLFDDIYDDPIEKKTSTLEETQNEGSALPTVSGTLYIDATDWEKWYYIDLPAIAQPETREEALAKIEEPYPIPTEETADTGSKTGIYTYWYDVFGQGISVNKYHSFYPTAEQTAPDSWSFAVHRNNARTNQGAVFETTLTDISQLSLSREKLQQLTYTADVWTENVVWTDRSQMLNCLIGNQGITTNEVLSSWLHVDLPPIPPAFTHNNHVFILKLNDNTFAAIQLANYMNEAGTKCHLSINYKYPL